MPTFVYMTRCDGCGHCVDICPSDIMHIDPTYRRAYNIEPSMCWECYSCVKACPQNAIDVRGVLEGLAARMVAESGVSAALAASLNACLREGDEIFNAGALKHGDDVRYAAMNGRFHALIVDAAQNAAVSAALSLNDKIPFVAPSTIAFDESARDRQFAMLTYAHRQHHAIVNALVNGEGARVDALMKEHTHISKESLNLSLPTLHLIAGAA